MAFQPAPSIAGGTIHGLMDSQLVILDLNFFATGGISGISLGSLAAALGTWTTDQLAPLLSRDVTFNSVRCVDLGTQTGPEGNAGFTAVGGVDQEAAPNNVAACISLRTDQRGRSGRGRNYIPGIPNTLVTLNTLDPTFMDDLINAYGLLVGAGTFVVGFQLVVLSRFTGGVPRANGIGIPVTALRFTTNKVRSMRSREVGHGA